MKLSFAAAATLLGPLTTVPTTLSQHHGPVMEHHGALRLDTKIMKAASPQSTLGAYHGRSGLRYKRRLMRRMANRNVKNSPRGLQAMMVPCDPRSTNADIGILSCGYEHICEPSITSSLGGICTPLQLNHQHHQELDHDCMLSNPSPLVNGHPTFTTTGSSMVQECEPSTSGDIGILDCEEGKSGKHDKTLGLRGFGVDLFTDSNRGLVTYSAPVVEDFLSECGPYPPEDPYRFCDCSGVNVTTGTGSIYCSQNITALLVQGCDEYVVYDFFAYSFNDSVVVKSYECYETKTPIQEKVCVFYTYDSEEPELEADCYAEWNDQRCNSCIITNYYSHGFDCSNVEGGRVGDARKELLSVLELCANSTCTNLCGDGSFIPDNNFGINVTAMGYNATCGALAFYEENAAFPDAVCHYFVEAAQSGGCCAPLNSAGSAGDDSSLPGSEPNDDSTIPVEDDEDDAASPPPADNIEEQDGASAYPTISSIASMTSQVAIVMVLVCQ